MSVVTNVILKTSLDEESAIDALNNALRHNPPSTWSLGRSFADAGADSTNIAGTKALECIVCLSAFNYLLVGELVAAIHAAPWQWPEQVQLFVQGQDGDRFEEIELFGRDLHPIL